MLDFSEDLNSYENIKYDLMKSLLLRFSYSYLSEYFKFGKLYLKRLSVTKPNL